MKRWTCLVIVAASLLSPGCGLGKLNLDGLSLGRSYYSNEPSGGGVLFGGCLEVTNDEGSGTHVLVAVLLHDVETHLLVREEPVHLLAGQVVNVMSIPAGFYEVVGVYEDWVQTPLPPVPPVVAQVHPELDAAVRFRHP